MDIKRMLMEGLNRPEADTDENNRPWYYCPVSTDHLCQALLDALNDAGHGTRNHTNSQDLEKLADKQAAAAADTSRQELLEAMRRYQDAKSALTMRPAGPGSLNHDFKEWAS
ncbi:hypothetical protein D5S18_15915 [Nocardia panacis]|uniref:Uncharacterized protein n=1 Tax=Nocardia panacis TaxID=2340916 RepID=A0A3A4KJR4_9NOCA|nr:hypothetical protein [Nocardia panacis]RJO74901.1 hypothetical protein D5S18_15915 [Nocardia panacis]